MSLALDPVAASPDASPPEPAGAGKNRLALPIEGMSCASCAGRVERALGALPSVAASVNLASGQARADFDPAQASAKDLVGAVRTAGYGVTLETLDLAVEGMSCASCVGRVEQGLSKVSGVTGVAVNLATGKARVEGVAGALRAADLLAALKKAGYAGAMADPGPAADETLERHQARAARREALGTAAALILAAPLVGQMAAAHLGLPFHLSPLAQLALATPVQFVLGARFYRAAWKGLRAGVGNMDLLVVLGTSAAYFYSLFLMLQGGGTHPALYFEAAAAVVALVRLGKWLEARARRATGTALRALSALRPEQAQVLRDGIEVSVPLALVASGDRVLVRPGERIAADGKVIEGSSEVDESLLTGESLPVAKMAGDPVTGGAMNGSGRLVIEATEVGAESRLARIIALVESAQGSKAPVQRLVDRVAGIFVPVVVALALLTFLFWWWVGAGVGAALAAAVAVLVIACPCALGLATPAALVVGTGRAAQAGILIRDPEALEAARRVDLVVLDKTGTLTSGRPAVTAVEPAGGLSVAGLLDLAAALQGASEHPLARAILEYASAAGSGNPAPVADFASRPGRGILGTIGKERFALGNRRLLEEEGLEAANLALDARAAALEAAGATVMRLARLAPVPAALGLIAAADPLRPTAQAAVSSLKAAGIGVLMLTGDNAGAAAAIARAAGIERFEAGILPEGKAEAVRRLKAQGAIVAMVGDGVNDAPALALADVGIAIGGGTDVAMAAAGITLMRSDPRLVLDAIRIARATRAKIGQNLFWAFVYNIVCIPLAAAGVLSPVIAGAAMALSSVSVVGNALTLRRWRPLAGGKEIAK